MTLVEYNTMIVQIRQHFISLTQTLLHRKRLSGGYDIGIIENQISVLGYYLHVLEDYFLPVKLIGTTTAGGSNITLFSSITPSDYDRYIGHIANGTGLSGGEYVTRFDADTIYLSGTTDAAASNTVIVIAESCVSEAEMRCIIADINKILGTSFCFDPYWTEYDLTAATADVSTNVLFTGSSASILTGITMYAALDKGTAPSGDTDVLFNFSLEYPYFAYPSTIADLTQILDQEGDDVLASGAFTKSLMNVTFPGVASTVQYKVYTTSYKTTINSKTYQFKF